MHFSFFFYIGYKFDVIILYYFHMNFRKCSSRNFLDMRQIVEDSEWCYFLIFCVYYCLYNF